MRTSEDDFNEMVSLYEEGLTECLIPETVEGVINYIHSLQAKIAMLELDSITTNSYRRVKEGS